MAGPVLVRIASGVLVFLALTLCVFVAFFALPRDAGGPPGRDDPYRIHGSLAGGYVHYVWRIVGHGDLGRSYGDREPVTTRLLRAAPVTLSLVLGGVAVWLALAIPLGLVSALRPRSPVDQAATVLVLVGACAHPVWLALVLSFLFGHYLHVLPAGGYCSIASLSTGCDGLVRWTSHLLLPWLTFGLLNAALYTMMTRALLLEELGEDYVRTARAKGVGDVRIVHAHVLRNVAPPLVTMVGMNIGTSLGGVVFVESAFDLPGLGGLLRTAALRRDLPLTAGSVVFIAAGVLLLNLLADLVCGVLDPRCRRIHRAH